MIISFDEHGVNLPHMRLSESIGISKLEKEFKLNSKLKKLYIIRKNGSLISLVSKN